MPTALNDLLQATSRSFYLIPLCGTLLPALVRPQIGLADGARRLRRFNVRYTMRPLFSNDLLFLNIEAA